MANRPASQRTLHGQSLSHGHDARFSLQGKDLQASARAGTAILIAVRAVLNQQSHTDTVSRDDLRCEHSSSPEDLIGAAGQAQGVAHFIQPGHAPGLVLSFRKPAKVLFK